ncbi:nucleotide exchange factor GrpE [Melissospora conviva]|uniref:nucleotide exchange factor GrpE n=1 Tax=Melissospora conviva TaxID=3388432 RepID=UPI003B809DCC
MTDKPRDTEPDSTGTVPADSATVESADSAPAAAGAEEAAAQPPAAEEAPSAEGLVEDAEVVVDGVEDEVVSLEEPAPAVDPVVDAPADPVTEAQQPADRDAGETAAGDELALLKIELQERTRDLQRVTAEYANYRKRVDRDRGVVAEQATGTVLSALLPILDDLDRAREHGDLVGGFGSVAEQLTTALGKFGLTAFGEQGDPFDPTRHEAVAHQTSAEVTEPTCVQVMRRGYQLGERMLRPAMVAVADPE